MHKHIQLSVFIPFSASTNTFMSVVAAPLSQNLRSVQRLGHFFFFSEYTALQKQIRGAIKKFVH